MRIHCNHQIKDSARLIGGLPSFIKIDTSIDKKDKDKVEIFLQYLSEIFKPHSYTYNSDFISKVQVP